MNECFEELKQKIKTKQARIAVIGLGYVGLPMGVAFARTGFKVTGIDRDENRVADLKRGVSYILDVGAGDLRDVSIEATTDYHVLRNSEVVIICVPTPLRKTKDPDLSFIFSATNEIVKYLHAGQLVILESTTYPGTTEELIQPELEGGGLKAGQDFFLAFSPERIDPGNTKYTIRTTPKIVGGATQACTELAAALYAFVVDQVVTVSSARSAEMVKLLENTFRAINIAMVNEIAIMCDRLGVDTWEVIDAAATKPFGFMPFYPGPGLGGHCIPVDPHYLAWKMKSLNYSARFIELAGEVNSAMPAYVVGKISDALNLHSKSVKSSRILIIGVAYKKDSSDVRESPAIDILNMLHQKEARISYHDPYVPELWIDSQTLRSVSLERESLGEQDCTVIVTDHSSYDWQFIADHSRLIVDTRNATRHVKSEECQILKL